MKTKKIINTARLEVAGIALLSSPALAQSIKNSNKK